MGKYQGVRFKDMRVAVCAKTLMPWETHFITIGFSGVKRAPDINSMFSGVFQQVLHILK